MTGTVLTGAAMENVDRGLGLFWDLEMAMYTDGRELEW